MRIGIFGGTFNPVHIGHVRAAEAFISEMELDRLFVLPNFIPPLKEKKSVPPEYRLEMLKLAFSESEKTIVSDFELKSGGTSYTYKTIEYFKSCFADDELYLLVGDDNLLIFQKWVNFDYILKNSILCIALRSGASADDPVINEAIAVLRQNYKAKIHVLSYTPTVISSTTVRNTFLRDVLPTDTIPPNVFEYICEKGLYK